MGAGLSFCFVHRLVVDDDLVLFDVLVVAVLLDSEFPFAARLDIFGAVVVLGLVAVFVVGDAQCFHVVNRLIPLVCDDALDCRRPFVVPFFFVYPMSGDSQPVGST